MMTRIGVMFILGVVFRPATVVAAEGGMINLDKSLLIQVINFLLLLVLLYKILYRPFLVKLEQRSAAIKKSLEDAELARTEAQRQREEHRAKVQAAHAEAEAVRAAALKDAAEEHHRLTESARQEATRIVEAGRVEIARDIRRAKEELRKEVGDLAVLVAERLMRRSLNAEDHKKVVQDAMERLEPLR